MQVDALEVAFVVCDGGVGHILVGLLVVDAIPIVFLLACLGILETEYSATLTIYGRAVRGIPERIVSDAVETVSLVGGTGSQSQHERS